MPLNAALAGFVCDALAYAEDRSAMQTERLLRSPFGGVDRDEACALVVATAREPLEDVIAHHRVPLSREGASAAARFTAGLAAVATAFRAQGIGARELLTTICGAFGLEFGPGDEGQATVAALLNIGARFDAGRGGDSELWRTADVIALIDGDLRATANTAGDGSAEGLQHLGPFAPEEARTVPRKRGHFSASSLGTYAECERKWFYRYVCAAVEDRGSSASYYGSAFHYALEHFHREFPRGDAAPARELETRLDAFIVDAFERFRRGFTTNVEFELQKRRARRTARRYLAWFLERSRAHPFEVIAQEDAVEVEWDGQRFVGYIDRVDRDDATGAITVVDYKTGSIATSAAEYRERIATFLDFQLPFYYWARTEGGERVTGLALVPLKDALLDIQPIELEVVPIPAGASARNAPTGVIGIDELERARREMIAIAGHLSDDAIEHFAVTSDPEACTFCVYKNACRDRPRQIEDRFGR